jgi:N-acetylmuramic acid 6-phosphate etherase
LQVFAVFIAVFFKITYLARNNHRRKDMQRITEAPSHYRHLEQMSIHDLLVNINREDQTVARSVEKAIPLIEPLVAVVAAKLRDGGRLFYIGAGTSGRLGVLDASECPPTYGVPENMVIGLIAGGDEAIRRPIEAAEDSETQAWEDLCAHGLDARDVVVGIAASGTTPYVIGALRACRSHGITTACITCNEDVPVLEHADFPIVVVTGPEFVTGSTRMKAGTAQKLVLNMISTSVMIQLGRVMDNKMVDMQLTNNKLVDRGVQMLMQATGMEYGAAELALRKYGSVRAAMEAYQAAAL